MVNKIHLGFTSYVLQLKEEGPPDLGSPSFFTYNVKRPPDTLQVSPESLGWLGCPRRQRIPRAHVFLPVIRLKTPVLRLLVVRMSLTADQVDSGLRLRMVLPGRSLGRVRTRGPSISVACDRVLWC